MLRNFRYTSIHYYNRVQFTHAITYQVDNKALKIEDFRVNGDKNLRSRLIIYLGYC